MHGSSAAQRTVQCALLLLLPLPHEHAMTMGQHGKSSLVALLRIIFSQATTSVSLAGRTEAERCRNIAFYDEVVTVAIRMTIPASNRTLPAPARDARSSFAMPLRSPNFDDDGDDEDNEHLNAPPALLVLLLSSLSVSLEAAYVPPRLAKPTASAEIPTESESTLNTHVIASVAEEDAAYQTVPLSGGGRDGGAEAARMAVKTWQGNTVPPKPNMKTPASRRGRIALDEANGHAGSADVWFARHGSEESWTVEWQCQLPIVFLRSRHPTPALILCANLSLQLQASRLSALAPSIAPPVTTSASEALYLHDLLNPLSEGPSYPDESPAERAARADASLAKLPLGKLPSSILGSKLVTPARSAKDVGGLIDARQRLLMESGGDMGDVASDEERSTGKPSGDGSSSAEQGLGEDMVTVRRSARRALDVRSAVLVRMRTTNIAGVGEGFGQRPEASSTEEDGTTPTPTLVLCVEVENPANSGVKFALDDIGVQVVVPSEAYGALHPTNRIHVEAKPIGSVSTPLVVEQGGQYNLLYRVDFVLPYIDVGAFDPTALMNETHRTITIELFGRPMMLRGGEAHLLGESFTSTWSCTLDFATQIQAVVLQHVIAQGSSGVALGRLSGCGLAGSTHTLAEDARGASMADRTATLPSTIAQRRVESLQSGYGGGGIEARRHAATMAQRPSLRVGTGQATDAFVSLQRSPGVRDGSNTFARRSLEASTYRDGGMTPAMPSSLIGPSILARARKNRNATLESEGGERRSGSGANGRRATLVHSAAQSADSAMIPGRVSSSSWHVRNALSGSHHALDVGAQPVLPLGSKATWARLGHLVHNASEEQGLLIDITSVVEQDDAALVHNVDVHMQLDNRSESMRTVLLQWKKPSLGQGRNGATSDPANDSLGWLADDDAVQVGPIAAGQAEMVVLRLRHAAGQDDDHDDVRTRTIPPLLLTILETGHQHTLVSVQPVVV